VDQQDGQRVAFAWLEGLPLAHVQRTGFGTNWVCLGTAISGTGGKLAARPRSDSMCVTSESSRPRGQSVASARA
jgi:hypothetical protein